MMLKISLSLFLLLNFAAPTLANQEAAAAFEIAGLSPTKTPLAEEKAPLVADFKDADLKQVLKLLGRRGNISVIYGPKVNGTVNMQLSGLSWDKAIDLLLQTYGYDYEKGENYIRVFDPVAVNKSIETEAITAQLFRLHYVAAANVIDALDGIVTERGSIKEIEDVNGILVTDVKSNMHNVRNVIQALDKPMLQAIVESSIVRTELGVTENLGIQWSAQATLQGSRVPTTFPFKNDIVGDNNTLQRFLPINKDDGEFINTTNTSGGSLDGFGFPLAEDSDFTLGTLDTTAFQNIFQFLKQRANTKIMSNPSIVVMNHHSASVQVGQEIGIPLFERNETTGSFEISGFEMRDVGVVMNVTPHIIAKGPGDKKAKIVVDLEPEVSSFTGFQAIGGTNLASPQFTTTTAQTRVVVSDNETIVIGGLVSDAEARTEHKVPGLHKVPLLGKLFFSAVREDPQNNNKIETIFFVTVRLSNPNALNEFRQKQEDSLKQYAQQTKQK